MKVEKGDIVGVEGRGGEDMGRGLRMIKGGVSEMMEKEKLSEKGEKNIKVGMERREKVGEVGNKVIKFEKEEV